MWRSWLARTAGGREVAGSSPVTPTKYLVELFKMWKEKNNLLVKKYTFDSFKEAIDFINQVAKLAIDNNHHPRIINDYNSVLIELSTHSEGKVTTKDHNLAKQIDKLNMGAKTVTAISAKLFTDGGSRGNPGPSAIGYAIYNQDDELVESRGEYLGITTNNQAEYNGLKQGLLAVARLGVKSLEVYMDSLLVVNQLKGEYKVKNVELRPIYSEVIEIAKNFDSIHYNHVPRIMNKVADQIVNDTLDAQA